MILQNRFPILIPTPPFRGADQRVPARRPDARRGALVSETPKISLARAREQRLIAGMLAWRATRAHQMVRQYPWLYVRSGLLGWREIVQENPP